MSFDVSALPAYIEDRDFPLIGAIQFDPEMTAMDATVQAGVKGKSNLHFMETNVIFQDGNNCSRTPSGTTTFTDKTIEVADITISEDLCLNDLKQTWLQIQLQQGTLQGKQILPEEIAAIYFDEKSKKQSQELDKADWQGDTTSVVNNLKRYDGWIKFIDAGSPKVGNTGGYTILNIEANIIAALQNMFKVIPQNIRTKDDLKIYLPWEWYDFYIIALINANLFHYVGEDGVTKLHGTNITIKPTFGLNETNRMFLTYGRNLVIGVDGENDGEFDIRLNPNTNKSLFVDADFTRGTQVQFVEDVVEFTLAAT
jgi:hypothetical protein